MFTAKHALLYKHKVPDGQAYVFYMDVRAAGKGYEEFVQRAMSEEGVLYLRGQVSRLFQDDGKLMVWGADTLSGKKIQVEADLVVLATAFIAGRGSKRPGGDAGHRRGRATASAQERDFAHPVETSRPGIFIAGAGRGPLDIPETVAQASAAAGQGDRSSDMRSAL